MRAGIAFVLGALLAFAGCDGRRAGTEVGNPEINVTALVSVSDFYDSVEVTSLHLLMMGMEYVLSGKRAVPDTGVCWRRPGGILLNLASDSGALADTAVEDGEWSHTEIVLRAPDGPSVPANLADYEALENPRYVKFTYNRPGIGDTLPALFEWPQGAEFHLLYGKESLDIWRWDDEIWVPVQFFAHAWAGVLESRNKSWVYRRDGRGARYILFSPQENAATWSGLKESLRDCFGSDSLIIR